MSARAAERFVRVVVAVIMLTAAAMKLESPAQAAAAIGHAFAPLGQMGQASGAAGALVLIVVEAGVGLGLLAGAGRGVRIATAALLGVFAAALVIRFTSSDAPPCGCLGRLLTPSHAGQAWMDAGRNVLLAGALLLTLPRRAGVPRVRAAPETIAAASVRGFTVVEVLVTIAIVAVLAAILVPVLAGARDSSAVSRSLSAQRQLVASRDVYGRQHADFFPHFSTLDNIGGPVRMRGMTIMTGYFRAHMAFWLAAVGPHDEGLINLAMWPPVGQGPAMTDQERANGIHHSVFYLSATVAADPAVFDGSHDGASAAEPRLLRGVRWAEMRFPSAKGLFLDFSMIRGEGRDRYVAAFGDGSAAEIPGGASPEPIVAQPYGGPLSVVMSTRGGIRGRDR